MNGCCIYSLVQPWHISKEVFGCVLLHTVTAGSVQKGSGLLCHMSYEKSYGLNRRLIVTADMRKQKTGNSGKFRMLLLTI